MENTGLMEEVTFEAKRKAEDIEADLSALDGVRSVTCGPDGKTVTVCFDPTIIDANRIRDAVGGSAPASDLIGETPMGVVQPVTGNEVAYGGTSQTGATQTQPPTRTV